MDDASLTSGRVPVSLQVKTCLVTAAVALQVCNLWVKREVVAPVIASFLFIMTSCYKDMTWCVIIIEYLLTRNLRVIIWYRLRPHQPSCPKGFTFLPRRRTLTSPERSRIPSWCETRWRPSSSRPDWQGLGISGLSARDKQKNTRSFKQMEDNGSEVILR